MGGFSRRSFLKSSAAGLGILAAGTGSKEYFTKVAHAAENDDVWKPAYCCACHNPICGTQVRVRGGVAVEIKGDPKSLTNEGRLCPRGNSVLGGVYHPYRAKTPMKRTNPEKGLNIDPGWVEISWDEALKTITEKMNEAKAYNPNSFVHLSGFGNEDSFKRLIINAAFGSANGIVTSGVLCPDHYGPMASQSTKVDRVDMQHCKLVLLVGRSLGEEWALAHHNTADYVKAVERGMKVICVNPRKTTSAQKGEWVPIVPGTDAAFCWALVHTVIHEIVKYDEKFLKWRTNGPYLIEDKPETLKGTKVLTEGYMRDEVTKKPLVWDTKLKKAVPFDSSKGDTYALKGSYEVNGKKVKPAFQIVSDYVSEFTPEWAEKISTVPAKQIRAIAKEFIDTANIGATIKIDGYEFPLRPVATFLGRGANCNPLNIEMYKALTIMNELAGCIDVPGGSLGIETGDFHPLNTDEDGMLVPAYFDNFANQYIGKKSFDFPPKNLSVSCFYPMDLGLVQLAWHSILDPKSYYLDYEVKVLMIHGGNPLASNANNTTCIAAMKKIPFIFDLALWMDEPTQFADIIIPEHHSLERAALWNAIWITNKGTTDKTRGMRAMLARKPVIPPVFNSRSGEDLYIELAQRTGSLARLNTIINRSFQGIFFKGKPLGIADEYALKPDMKYSYDDIIDRKLKSVFGAQSGWKDFEKCAVKTYSVPTIKESYNYYWAPENKIRVPMYFEYSGRNIKIMKEGMKKHGVTFPHADIDDVARQYSSAPMYYEFPSMRPTKEYPFKVFQFKTHFQVNDSTGLVFNHWLREIQDNYDPNILKILVPHDVGVKMGLKENDEIIIESIYGYRSKGRAHLSQMIHPQTIGISGKWGREGTHIIDSAKEGASYNILLNDDQRDQNFVMGNLNNSVCVKIMKA